MSDTNTPSQPIEAPPIVEVGFNEMGHESLLNPETNAMLDANFKESARRRHSEDQLEGEIDEIVSEEAKMVELEKDDPEEYIRQLGAMAVVRNKAEGAKYSTNVESRTYKQVADGVVSREEVQLQHTTPEKKPWPNLLNSKFVRMVIFGEDSSKRSAYKVPKARSTSRTVKEMAGGNMSEDAVNRLNYPR